MPFADAGRPSIQLGLLKALGEACGFPVSSLRPPEVPEIQLLYLRERGHVVRRKVV